MKNKIERKEFALSQIAPYFADPTICGYNGRNCVNLTDDGKMCVVGKNLLPEVREQYKTLSVNQIFDEYKTQKKIFNPEVAGILTKIEWGDLQLIHDAIATEKIYNIPSYCKILGLFTYEELVEYSKKLKN